MSAVLSRLLCAALLLAPAAASAHGSGLVLFVIGMPWAGLAWLIAAIVFVRSGARPDRWARVLVALVLLPVWALLFIGPWFSSWEVDLRPFEEWWALGLPALLLALVIHVSRLVRPR